MTAGKLSWERFAEPNVPAANKSDYVALRPPVGRDATEIGLTGSSKSAALATYIIIVIIVTKTIIINI